MAHLVPARVVLRGALSAHGAFARLRCVRLLSRRQFGSTRAFADEFVIRHNGTVQRAADNSARTASPAATPTLTTADTQDTEASQDQFRKHPQRERNDRIKKEKAERFDRISKQGRLLRTIDNPEATFISVPHTLWRPAKADFCVLGIETSCDDTGAAVVDSRGNVLGEGHRSSVAEQALHGGIVPAVAAVRHAEFIDSVIETALKRSGKKITEIDAIAVTTGPGLAGSLAVGLGAARAIVRAHGIPLIPIHHIEAHMLMPLADNAVTFPFVALLATGGHCMLLIVKGYDSYEVLGNTVDDAPGEAFDKVARMLELDASSGGGRALEACAANGGDMCRYIFQPPMFDRRDCEFSFSGLKTAVRTVLEKGIHSAAAAAGDQGGLWQHVKKEHVAASFQRTVAVHLATRTGRALLYAAYAGGTARLPDKATKPIQFVDPARGRVPPLVFSGGVAANKTVRAALETVCRQLRTKMVCPPPELCTDNGVMIAHAAVKKLIHGNGGRGARVVVNRPLTPEEAATAPEDGFPEADSAGDLLSRLRYRTRWPLGKDIGSLVAAMGLSFHVPWGSCGNVSAGRTDMRAGGGGGAGGLRLRK